MKTIHPILTVLCVALLAGPLAAQTSPSATSPPALPMAEPVLTHVPAGALGYVVINNIQQVGTHADMFLSEVGLSGMLGFQGMPGEIVTRIKQMAMLGDGFNPNAGFAVVMLDPQQFGVDVLEIMGIAERSSTPTTAPAQQKKFPFVLLVPGKGIEAVFGNYEITQVGQLKMVHLRMGNMFASQCGGYIALSPNSEALAALLGASEKAGAELTKSQAAMLAKSDLAVYVNMKIAGPLYKKILQTVEAKLTIIQDNGMPAGMANLFSAYMPIYQDMVSQLDSAVITAKIAPTGIVLSESIRWDPQSRWGKMIAAFSSPGGKLLDRLPNLPYVLAMGAKWSGDTTEARKFSLELVDKMLSADIFAAIDEQTKSKIKKITDDYYSEMTGYQLVLGGAPEGSGVFGVGVVIQCKDAERMKTTIAESADVSEAMIKALMKDNEDAQSLKLTYAKGAATSGEISVDTIDVSWAGLKDLTEEDRQNMVKFLGEDRILLRLAAIDNKTVVMTFGGAEPFFAEAVKAARSGGMIDEKVILAEAAMYMPDKPMTIMVLSPGNAIDIVIKAAETLNQDSMVPPFQIASKSPIVIGASYEGSEVEIAFYVPNSLIKEVAGMFMMFAGPPTTAPGQQPMEDDDF